MMPLYLAKCGLSFPKHPSPEIGNDSTVLAGVVALTVLAWAGAGCPGIARPLFDRYRGFGGGGCGFGTPVVSYAPRPILNDESVLRTIEACGELQVVTRRQWAGDSDFLLAGRWEAVGGEC